MIKKEDRAEFIGQVIDIFEDFLDEKCITIPNAERDADPDYNPAESANVYGSDYGFLQDKLGNLFISWKVLEDERPLIDYQFKVSINGVRCEGSVSVKAVDPDDAYQKAQEKVSDRLCRAFPELDIEYDVEPVESEGYPIYRISSKRNRFDAMATATETTNIQRARELFQMLVSDNAEAWLEIRTSKTAEWSTIQRYLKK